MHNLLAIDIHDGFLTAVLLDQGTKVAVVHSHAVVPYEDGKLEEAIDELLQQVDFDGGECRLSLSPEKFFFRNLSLPFTDKQKIEKILPLELEDQTSLKIDELHHEFAIIDRDGEASSILVAMVDRVYISQILHVLRQYNLDPDVISISGMEVAAAIAGEESGDNTFVLLDIGLKKSILTLVENGQIVLIRSLAINSSGVAGIEIDRDSGELVSHEPTKLTGLVDKIVPLLHQTLLSMGKAKLWQESTPCYLTGPVGVMEPLSNSLQQQLPLTLSSCDLSRRPLLKIEPTSPRAWNASMMNRALALALHSRKGMATFNLRSGQFKKLQSLKKIRKTIVEVGLLVALICVGFISYSWWDFNSHQQQKEQLKQEINDVFKQTLPSVTRIVKPLEQMQVKIDETRRTNEVGGGGAQGVRYVSLLAELSRRIPPRLDVRITRLVADNDDVRIKGLTGNFNTVDNVQKELEKSEYFSSVEISSANLTPKSGEVRFELRLEFK